MSLKDGGSVASQTTAVERGDPQSRTGWSFLLTLRQPNYRWFWISSLSFALAIEMQRLLLPWLAFEISNSTLVLGLVGFCVGVPNVLFSPFGGVLADRRHRAVLIRTTQAAAAGLAVGLAVVLLAGSVQVWHVVVFALLSGSVSAFDQPTRHAILRQLVPRKVITNAVALNASAWFFARVGGPALGGLLLALTLAQGTGPGGVFLVVAVGYALAVFCTTRIRIPPPEQFQRSGSVLGELSEGIRYVAGRSAVRMLMLIVFANSIFGSSYILLMPVFAREVYQVDERGLGLLVASFGAGAVLGAVALGVLGLSRRRGLLVLVSSVAFGLLLMVFASSRSMALSIPVLVAIGATSGLYLASANTLLQLTVPDGIRGRVMGIYALVWNLAPMGAALSGAVAAVWGAPTAVMLGGGIVVSISLAVAVLAPELRKLD